MSDKLGLGLGSEVRPLRLGSSFTGKNNPFHTIRYDFKPASVDTSKMACVEVANNNQVTVTVPHCDGAGTASTVFKGPQKPYNRECVLIIDNETGQITLEKLSQNLMLKKTRAEGSSRMSALVPEDPPPPPSSSSSSHSRAPIPISSSSSSFHPPSSSSSSSHSYSQPHSKKPSPGRKSAHMKRSVSPLTKSPPAPPQVSKPTPAPAPPSSYAPPQALPSAPKLPGSMPFLGLDMEDDSDGDQSNSPFHMPSAFSATPSSAPAATSATNAASTTAIRDVPEVGVLSDSSSDSGSGSDSSSSSDSDSDSDIEKRSVPRHNGSNGGLNRAVMERAEPPPAAAPTFSMPSHLLSEDLQLSDSGSDSD